VVDGLRSAGFEVSSATSRFRFLAGIEHLAQRLRSFVEVSGIADLGPVAKCRLALPLDGQWHEVNGTQDRNYN
jgi:hypothetical protein